MKTIVMATPSGMKSVDFLDEDVVFVNDAFALILTPWGEVDVHHRPSGYKTGVFRYEAQARRGIEIMMASGIDWMEQDAVKIAARAELVEVRRKLDELISERFHIPECEYRKCR